MRTENVKNNRIIRHLFYYLRGIFQRKKLRRKAEVTIKKFGLTYASAEEKEKQIRDMIRMNMLHGFEPSEYLYYGLLIKP